MKTTKVKLKGRVTAIRTCPQHPLKFVGISEIDVVVREGVVEQVVYIRTAGGRSFWDALENQEPVEVEIVTHDDRPAVEEP